MSALGSQADICNATSHVRFTPNNFFYLVAGMLPVLVKLSVGALCIHAQPCKVIEANALAGKRWCSP
jgi:hypothetical protein